jgi:translation initiation factor IF-2
VAEGKVARDARARVVRDGQVIHQGKIGSLRRFKDDVREVQDGMECGIGLASFNDIHPGDVLEVYELEEIAPKL